MRAGFACLWPFSSSSAQTNTHTREDLPVSLCGIGLSDCLCVTLSISITIHVHACNSQRNFLLKVPYCKYKFDSTFWLDMFIISERKVALRPVHTKDDICNNKDKDIELK